MSRFMCRFDTLLQNKCVTLHTVVDVVRFSFVVRTSISYLNLQLSEYSKLSDRSRTVSEVANDFVCTEEKCRTVFGPSRSLLYSLHLGMPVRREGRLMKNDPRALFFCARLPLPRTSRLPHMNQITASFRFDYDNTSKVIVEALKVTDQNKKLKILGLFIKSPVLKEEIFNYLPPHIISECIGSFYPEITDSVLFKGFVDSRSFKKWVRCCEDPEILEYLLYHVRHHGIILEKDGYSMNREIDYCIERDSFRNIKPILKFIDAPDFSPPKFSIYVSSPSRFWYDTIIKVEAKAEVSLLAPQRLHLVLQILYMYLQSSEFGRTESASETLRLLWNSSPVPCITAGEIEMALGGILSDADLADMFEFYSNSIGEVHSVVEPRPLQHLCRTTLRRILKDNFWIPEGVRLTGLPQSLQLYLNLEKNCFSYLSNWIVTQDEERI